MDKAKNIWWRAFLSIAYGIGLRRDEILNLAWKNIDFEEQLVTVTVKKESQNLLGWDPKGRKNRMVPLSDESAQLLANLQLKAEETFPYIFISPERLKRIRERQKIGTWNPSSQIINNLDRNFRLLRQKAGVNCCTLHDFRRTAITNWAKKLPIQVVQQLAGHEDISTTSKYYLPVRSEELATANKFLNQIVAKAKSN